ncbi:nitroreductase family deazaflavin-dependent oxidoreductase [Agromyces sp. MMS24-K17]|uniref:nitroreductase family deazaflavin-dependent oxidoreductase n=1 Tax=Agromyces sp. MMS24-K17 TaxID=3372850 RepID=UPI0037543F52
MTSADAPRPPRRAARATEPVARALAGRRWFPLWAVIHHRGRKSGTEYATPIAVVPTTSREVILIGLPWGAHTNWARNVVAAGGATLTWKGREHRAGHPRIIDGGEAAALAQAPFRGVVRRFPAAIVLSREPGEQVADAPA